MHTVAWTLFSKSTKQKKYFLSFFDVFEISLAAMYPGNGLKM